MTMVIDAMGLSRPSHFVPVLNNVRYASDSDHSRYESELTLWANSGSRAYFDPITTFRKKFFPAKVDR